MKSCANQQFSEISTKTVYQRIYADKQDGGILWKNLGCQKKQKKWYGKNDRRGQISNRKSFEERSTIVDKRERIADWEIDMVTGKNHRQALVTIVVCKSKLTLIRKVVHKNSKAVTEPVIELLKRFRAKVLTIISDNGKEFAVYDEIAGKLKADFYFAHLYASWVRVQTKTRTD